MKQISILFLALLTTALFMQSCKKDCKLITVDAGISQTIQLPANIVTLTGTVITGKTDGMTYLWTLVSGPSVPVFSSSTAVTTSASGLVAGKYVFQFNATNNTAMSGLDTVSMVFLDIEMPYGNGFDLLDKLSPITFEVIFITAFNNYAVKAFKYAAVDYILKPVNINELKDAVQKVARRQQEKIVNSRITSLLNNLKPENSNAQKIGLSTNEEFYFEEIKNIMYLEASGSYAVVFTKDGNKKTVSKNLKEFEDILPDNVFCRVHHSYIINTNFIKKYYKGRGGYVEMEDGANIAISVRKKEYFLEKFTH